VPLLGWKIFEWKVQTISYLLFVNGPSLISQASGINIALKKEIFSFIFDRLKMILLVLLPLLGTVVTGEGVAHLYYFSILLKNCNWV